MRKLYKFFAVFAILIYAFGDTSVLYAAQNSARFSELTVMLSQKKLLLFAKLQNSITKDMKEALQSGIPLKFTFTLQLYRSAGKTDELLHKNTFTHTLTYNTLKNEYVMRYQYDTIEGKDMQSKIFSTISVALESLNSINGIVVLPEEQLLPNNTYRLRLKADLFHKNLNLSLAKFLPFLRWDNRAISWQEVIFQY